ncbi:MAG: right-handed parallel beta-helix repeat-containing protein [Clostridiales bacterium]|jgi:polygalacturonase|nr:right-handed parallel beta-helix repeat-containing protein [Clostridiales bacterium]
MKKRIMLIAVISLIIIVGLTTVFAAFKLYYGDSGDGLSRIYKYRLNEDASRVVDIPRGVYLKKESLPADKTIYDATAYGLSGQNSGAANSEAIARAVFEAKDGGGIVFIPSGEYKTSGIELKSNVTLWIDDGAVLKSMDYDENRLSASPLKTAVIYAEGAENIAVTGGGAIDGRGTSYTKPAKNSQPFYPMSEFNLKKRVLLARTRIREPKGERYNIINLLDCKNVTISNIELRESASWTVVLRNSSEISIENIVIDNNIYVANSDGIDLVGCSDADIKNCFIATGDDGICIKSNSGRSVKNITVAHCEIMSLANCFKIGTETIEDISNIEVSDCFFFVTEISGGYSGIAVESADGANIDGVRISGIEMRGVSAPFLIWLGCRFKDTDNKAVGSIKNVVIKNIEAYDTETASAIVGCEYKGEIYRPKNIVIDNFFAEYRDTDESLNVLKNPPQIQMNGYPEITRVSHIWLLSHELSLYCDLPAYGLYIRYADGVTLKDSVFVPRTANKRKDIIIDE